MLGKVDGNERGMRSDEERVDFSGKVGSVGSVGRRVGAVLFCPSARLQQCFFKVGGGDKRNSRHLLELEARHGNHVDGYKEELMDAFQA
jgi:hypothetical protein